MKKRNKKHTMLLLTMLVLIATCTVHINASAKTKFTKTQQKRAEYIASICEKNWYTYKVYPSVCLGQAVAESGMGKQCRKNNYWGLGSGRYSYSSLKKGTLAYLKCVSNKKWYGSLKGLTYKQQVHQLASHGYCGGDKKAYERWVLKCIKEYDLTSYDKKMKKNLAAAEKKKKKSKDTSKPATKTDITITRTGKGEQYNGTK